MMKFEVGKYYQHNNGLKINVMARVEPFETVTSLSIAAVRPDGSSEIGYMQAPPEEVDVAEWWTEISKEEFYANVAVQATEAEAPAAQ